jgi:hypothetical protein
MPFPLGSEVTFGFLLIIKLGEMLVKVPHVTASILGKQSAISKMLNKKKSFSEIFIVFSFVYFID